MVVRQRERGAGTGTLPRRSRGRCSWTWSTTFPLSYPSCSSPGRTCRRRPSVARSCSSRGRRTDGSRSRRATRAWRRYEEAMMVVEAGPRVWRDGSPAEGAGSRDRDAPETVEGTVLLDLVYDLPTVLPKLLQPWTDVPAAPEGRTKLLVRPGLEQLG